MAIPKPKVWWPLIFTAALTGRNLPFRENGVTERVGVIPPSAAFLSAKEFMDGVVLAMNLSGTALTFTWSIDSTGVVSITNNSATPWRWSWNSFPANAGFDQLGWFQVDTADAAVQTSPRSLKNGWWSPVAVRDDTKDQSEDLNSVMTVAAGGQNKSLTGTRLTVRELEFSYLPPVNTRIADDAVVTVDGRRAIESWWINGRARFRYWPDMTDEVTLGDYFLDGDVLKDFKPVRVWPNATPLTVGRWKLRKYVA